MGNSKYSDFTLFYYNGRKTAKIKIGRDTAILIYNGMVLETDYDSALLIL